jgi:cobalt/nickel transport system ATP-binding protein
MTESTLKALIVKQLNYHYRDGHRALDNISFTINEGERLGLIGPNGAGKSTLLQHLNGLLPDIMPKQDSDAVIHIFNRPMTAAHLSQIRADVGLLFQDPDDQLFCPTIFEDVAFGPQQLKLNDAEIKQRVTDALHAVGLAGYEQRLPHHLSRGEKHRACLAGLLACNAKILALDEPTSHLDPRGRREFKALLKSLSITQIIASHDLDMVAEICDRVIVLDQGKIVSFGATLDILSDETLMLKHGLEKPHFLKHPHPH